MSSQFNVSIPRRLAYAVRKRCMREGLTVSGVIRRELLGYLARWQRWEYKRMDEPDDELKGLFAGMRKGDFMPGARRPRAERRQAMRGLAGLRSKANPGGSGS